MKGIKSLSLWTTKKVHKVQAEINLHLKSKYFTVMVLSDGLHQLSNFPLMIICCLLFLLLVLLYEKIPCKIYIVISSFLINIRTS